MLFMAEMEVALPPDMDPAVADDLKAREKAICQALQRDGRWPHLWRVAGRYANVSVFDVGIARRAARAAQRAAAVPVHGHPGDRAGAASIGARRRLTTRRRRELWPIERTS